MSDDENAIINLRRAYEKDSLVAYIVRRFKEVKVELGQANSEIDFLNDEIKKMKRNKEFNDETSREARKEIKKEEMYLKYREEIKVLQDKLKKVNRDNQDLIMKICKKS